MTHLKPINQKANRVVDHVKATSDEPKNDVVALQQTPPQQPHFPLGCSLVFSPG